jgi:23S rRNA pseudouridine1911/1915/1917 synthase
MLDPAEARFEVVAEDAGERLDAFLAQRLSGQVSRSRLRQLIKEGAVRLDGQADAKPSARLAAGSLITVDLPPEPAAPQLRPNPELPLSVIYSDERLIVVDKPAGMVVHPAIGHADDTLVNAILARFPDQAAAFAGSMRPGIVHRIDRDTSGLLVVARDPEAARSLKAQFKGRSVEKTYGVLVKGRPSPAEGIIDVPIGRDPLQRKRMSVQPGGKPAQTHYRTLATRLDYSWLEAMPRTGRTHQIRVHLTALGHPVASDPVYGRRDRRIGRLALHAWRLAIEHPGSGARMAFEAPLPEDLRLALAELGMAPTEP